MKRIKSFNKYFNENIKYFKWYKLHKDDYEILSVSLLKNNKIIVKYKRLSQN